MRGSVVKYATRKGDRWSYAFDAGTDRAGTRRQIRRGGFLTRKEATAAMQAQLVARRTDDYIEPSQTSLTVYLDAWLDDIAPSIAPATYHNYQDHVTHLKGQIGTAALGRLSPPMIAEAYRVLGERLAPSTLRITHAVLRAALSQAVRWRMRRDNPADYVTLPAVTAEGETVWTAEEASRFLRETAADPGHALWRVLLSTGMRLGEALALPWSALDLETGRVAIVRTLATGEGERIVVVERTKTKAGRRTLDLDAAVVAALRQHRTRQTARRLASRDWYDTGLVFDRRDGRHCWPQTIRRRLERACADADVPIITPKALRHTAATLMVANGVPLHAVKGILGHANIQLTANLYSHYSPDATTLGLAELARVLEG